MQLGKLLAEANRKKEAADVLERLNYIYPMHDGLHQQLGQSAGSIRATLAGAIREFKACWRATPSTRRRRTSTWRAPII